MRVQVTTSDEGELAKLALVWALACLINMHDPKKWRYMRTDVRFQVSCLLETLQERSWTANVRKHYGYDSLAELQEYWLAWVGSGSGPTQRFAKVDPSRTPVVQTAGVGSIDSHVALAGPTQSQRDSIATRIANAGPAHNRITSAAGGSTEQGWYSRLKDQTLSNAATRGSESTPSTLASNSVERGTAQDAIVPPSVRNSGRHSVSQPRPEEQISRSGSPVYETIDMRTIRRFR